MSVRFQCCGIAILVILMFFQGRQRKTHLLTERIFRLMVRVALLSLSLDVLSIVAINRAFNTPGAQGNVFWVDLVCKVYMMTIPLLGLTTLLYLCVDAYPKPRQYQKMTARWSILLLLGWVGILAAPIEYARGSDGVVHNTTGPSVYTTYCLIAFFLILICYRLIRDWSRLNQRRRLAVFAWLSLWVGSFFIQVLNNSLLLAGFASAMGMLIVYLALENPEANLDKQTGLLARNVLLSYLRQLYTQRRKFSALALVLQHSPAPRLNRSVEEIKSELCRYLEDQREWMVFKEGEDRLFLIFDTPEQATAAKDQITLHFRQRWRYVEGLPLSLKWIYMPQAHAAQTQAELLFLMDYAARKYPYGEELIAVDDDLLQEVSQGRDIERKLAAAMAQDRIEVFYQPIYSTSRRAITCAEALVRIRDEEGNLIPPGLFIPIAESNGMILRLGRLIFEKVCLFIRQHPLQELGLDYIEVNLSMVQCAHTGLATEYIDTMRRFGIDPRQINLEITESASIDAKKALQGNMDQLIAYGVSFSLDDFGTGQSNLDYIMDLPVEITKFDRGMTQAYFISPRARQVMNAAIHMIHNMGLKIVSEGIETAEQFKAVLNLGIEYIQGYYFSRPLPQDEFLDFLADFQPPEEALA